MTAQWEIRALLGFGKAALEKQIPAHPCPTALRQPGLREGSTVQGSLQTQGLLLWKNPREKKKKTEKTPTCHHLLRASKMFCGLIYESRESQSSED